MARSYGSAATLLALKESTYGVKPTGNWEKFAFVSSDLSAEQNLLSSDLLGQGREPRAPFRDVINDEGNLVVPVEGRDFGRWLQLLLGNPVSAGVAATGDITFTANPSATHTITINGVTWTFVASGATGTQTNIGANLNATLTQLATDLNASVNASITPATYSNGGGTKLNIVHDTVGATGNNFTLASGNANGVVSGATLSGGGYTHTFVSGAASLPSFAAEIGHANVPAYFVHTGCMLGSMALNFQRSGAANATLNIIAQGETRFASTQGGTPTARVYKPFSQFNGSIKRNGASLANITGAQFTYSNGLQAVPTIRNDGLIEAVDPTIINVNGSIDVRFADTTLVDDAINNTAIELELAYKLAGLDGNNFSLTWTFHEVYLPRPRITKAVRGLQEALNPTREQQKSQLEEEIADLQNSFGTKLDIAVLGSAPGLEAKKRELQKINDEIAAEQKKADEDTQNARTAAEKAAAERRNNQLLELQKKYLKEYEDVTLTSQQKILRDAEERRKQILALNKGDANSEAAREALAALGASTKAKLADANKTTAKSSGSTKDDSEETRKRAIQEVNRALLQTKPSYDLAKQALDEWKAKLIENLGGATEANQEYIDKIEQIYSVKLKEIYNKSLLDSDKWEDGASRALGRYADEATNAAKNAEDLFGSAATKVEDTLVDMVTTGEFSFKKLGDLVQSIEQDILRMFIRQQITGPIAGALGDFAKGSGGDIFGSIFGSLFHDGGVVGVSGVSRRAVPAYAFAGAPRFHSGLMPDEFPAILQKGETVLPKNTKMGGNNITFNITTPNAQSFMESQGQIMSKLAAQMGRHKARNG